ncbi:MAG: beta-propeller domain-containing protein [Candidatus Bathyarchaeota archaeon]|nr:beta-propeller domain-containing protein [Candidatus Bathyarchaeota archaeon]
MVQKEVKKKTSIYGTVAVLSAIVLVTLIYVYGTVPAVLPPTETPPVAGMKTFSSYEELKNFLATNTKGGYTVYSGGPLDAHVMWTKGIAPLLTPAPASVGNYGSDNAAESYSTTNIQVAGVDEADIVKTDGKYIYVASNNDFNSASQNNVYIVKADLQDPHVVAKIALGNETYVAGLFLSQDSSKLVVIGSQYQLYAANEPRPEIAIYPYFSSVNTFITVYDISEKAMPVLARNLTLSGSYFNSRMIGNYVYAVISEPAYVIQDVVTLPKVYQNEAKASQITAEQVYYAESVDNYFTFTTFIGLNILDNTQQPTNITVMMGGTSAMYVSMDNIYVTYSTWNDGQYTSIYRVRVDGSELKFEAKGSIPGYVLNQYSMDEYNGYFRVATTWEKTTQMNNVYVLNMNMSQVGKLENLAEGERIYSARFMGDKAYLVTFRQTDPFFVIDMRNPANPRVAGELKIPGYSSYLHPFDENHVIGLGMENSTVKLSLFDVTNVNAPTETARYIVEGDWTYSQALDDPKAFLFDKQKELLVIPVSITQYGVVDSTSKDASISGGFWQGAYVFKVTTSGFTLRGGITHAENTTSASYYEVNYNQQVNRALYISNTLYTISNAKIKLNSLTSLAPIAEVNLK